LDNKSNISQSIIPRFLADECTQEEENLLASWRAESTENDKQFLELEKAQQLGEQHYNTRDRLDLDVNKEWKAFLNKIGDQKDSKVLEMKPAPIFSQPWFRIAASVVLILAIGFAVRQTILQSPESTFIADTQTKEITLPDGSTITLNRHSSLTIQDDFGDQERRVKLVGEAFFDVVRDASKAFVIESSKAEITVLGTSFNVKNEDSSTEVIVASGMVKLAEKNTAESIVLKVGESGILEKGALIRGINQDHNFMSWKTRILTFEGERINIVLDELEEAYGVVFEYSIETPANCNVSVTFEQQSIESVMKVLKSTLDIEYSIDGTIININRIGC